MAGSLTDIFAAMQNGVVALGNFRRQLTGSFNNISGQLTTITNNTATNTTNISSNSAHIAALEATVANIVPATKAQQQTGTSSSAYVTPLHQQDHDSAVKAWAFISSSGALNASYNVSSVTHSTGTGIYIVNWTTPFATANYTVVAMGQATTATGLIAFGNGAAFNSSNCQINTITSSGALLDPSIGLHVTAYGRQ